MGRLENGGLSQIPAETRQAGNGPKMAAAQAPNLPSGNVCVRKCRHVMASAGVGAAVVLAVVYIAVTTTEWRYLTRGGALR